MSAPLRKGYTTGVHTVRAFEAALEGVLVSGERTQAVTRKMDNDDLDVTKGCTITVTLSPRLEDLECNPIPHTPYTIGTLKLYAGVGVGVVTRPGLKPPVGYPAINPVPLEKLQEVYDRCAHPARDRQPLFGTVSVTDGEKLARQSANAKVGVQGGISILGTTGWVKPVSSDAWLDSIRAEVGFAAANRYDQVVLTLGNASLAEAKRLYASEQIIEVGNFVHDALSIVHEAGIGQAVFVCGIGKAVKVMQGHRNTHNRFGQIDLTALAQLIRKEMDVVVAIEDTRTVQGIVSQLGSRRDDLYAMVEDHAAKVLGQWFPKLDIAVEIVR